MLANPEPWMTEGSCHALVETLGGRERDRLFFPSPGEPTRQAKAMCFDCPVRQDCLDFAQTNGIRYGIWGGTSERERRRMRREMALGPAPRSAELTPRRRAVTA